MKILLLADEESKYLWDYFEKEKLDGIDLIISCGDLKAEFVYKGLRIAGLGGSMSYSMRKYQYTERQMYQRWSRLKWKVRIRGGLDILVAHAPAKDLGDAEDLPHQGFRCFRWIMKHYKPAYFFHGHVHMNYRRDQPRVSHYLDTTIINAYERYVIEVPEPAKKRKFWERMNKLLYPKDIYY